MKINSNFKAFAGLNFDSTKYISSPSYGVNRFMLDRIGSEKARATTIVQYQPNSKFPEHEHIGGEEFLVLEGTFKDQHGEFPAGTYVRNPIGSKHSPWVDDDGCTIMVKLLQMSEPLPDETKPMYVHDAINEKSDQNSVEKTNYGSVLQMYSNTKTGEHVEMCWINPNTILPTCDVGINGGEELFVYDGSLILDEGKTEYFKWGWLRFPVANSNSDDGSNRATLKAGSDGARVYRKTGHLTTQALSMEKIQITED